MKNETFIEVDYSQVVKKKHVSSGDVFISTKTEDNRIIAALADGLGSGIKANVLATLTATMTVNFIKNKLDIKKSAEIIIDTLPVCNVRKIGYSTFTVTEIDSTGKTRVIEYDNPKFLYCKNEKIVELPHNKINLKSSPYKENIINYYKFNIDFGDRLVFFSDGVTQSGMGKDETPLGWEYSSIKKFVADIITKNYDISARDLSRKIINQALIYDDNAAHDDITCLVIYCRKPRNILVVTGPSIKKEKDSEMALMVKDFSGKKIICGGTTANILSRELKEEVVVDIKNITPDVPPCAYMKGVDLITEGILTLSKVAQYLENYNIQDIKETNAATKIIDLLINNDILHFIVGTKINEAHQDPMMPVDIEIRRNIVRRIITVLKDKYLKKVFLDYI